MFGTMGFSELMIILVIILIIFGAGRLPQIGEGVGKALKGFKKEVADLPSAMDPNDPQGESPTGEIIAETTAPISEAPVSDNLPVGQATNTPFVAGPEQTPGTAAAKLYQGAGPKLAQQPSTTPTVVASVPIPTGSVPGPVSMEDRQAQPAPVARAQYPALPSGAQAKPLAKRPSAIVNKQAVARVQAQQAARKAQANAPAPQDMQSLGEGLGSAVRTFRDAAADIKNSVDPQMRTIQAEMEAAELEMKETIETAKQPLAPKEPSGTV